MLKWTNYSSPDGHTFLKCKTCKNEFYVVNSAYYVHSIMFCPYCGDYARKRDKPRNRNKNTVYGAKVSQNYIQLPKGRKKLRHRYPASIVYPYSCYRRK